MQMKKRMVPDFSLARVVLFERFRMSRVYARRALLFALMACSFLVYGVGTAEAEGAYTIYSKSPCPGCAVLGSRLGLPIQNGGIAPGSYDLSGVKVNVTKSSSPSGSFPYVANSKGEGVSRDTLINLVEEAKKKDGGKNGKGKDDEKHGKEMWCCKHKHPGPKGSPCNHCASGAEGPSEQNKHDQKCPDNGTTPDLPPPAPDGGGGGGGGGGDGGGGGGLGQALGSMLPALMQGMNQGQQQPQPSQTPQPDDGSALIMARAAQTAAAQATAVARATAVPQATALPLPTPATRDNSWELEARMFPPLSRP